MTLSRRLAAEGVGTCLLLAIIVGSGIMAERLAGGSMGLALLCNALATGAGLVSLILAFGRISAHFNPAVTLTAALDGLLPRHEALGYCTVQIAGAFSGVAAAHLMFGEPLLMAGTQIRNGSAQWWSEFMATFGLLAVIQGCGRFRIDAIPVAVGCYITCAYWFTASTAFANPAVTLARAATDTFAGIRLADTFGFIAAQLAGALTASAFFRWLIPTPHSAEI